MTKNLLIVGASGHGRVCVDVATEMGCFNRIDFLDDDAVEMPLLSSKIVGKLDDIHELKKEYSDFFVGIGNNLVREKMLQVLFHHNFNIINLVHPTAIISRSAKISPYGCLICEGTVIKTGATIGTGSIINTAAVIEHDCSIGDYSHISPNATLAGTVTVGSKTWIGVGATIINNISIGDNCIIGAGAVVISDVESDLKVVGVPHRCISSKES